jgi:MFS superfamily sulfate permease-like transporter
LIRIDENITFTNIHYIEDYLANELRRQPGIKHVVLIFTSVSDIDTTALEALETINHVLQGSGKTLNIAEAKGPVIDKLKKLILLSSLNPARYFSASWMRLKNWLNCSPLTMAEKPIRPQMKIKIGRRRLWHKSNPFHVGDLRCEVRTPG